MTHVLIIKSSFTVEKNISVFISRLHCLGLKHNQMYIRRDVALMSQFLSKRQHSVQKDGRASNISCQKRKPPRKSGERTVLCEIGAFANLVTPQKKRTQLVTSLFDLPVNGRIRDLVERNGSGPGNNWGVISGFWSAKARSIEIRFSGRVSGGGPSGSGPVLTF